MTGTVFCTNVIYFAIYSVVGWICETIFCSFNAGKFVKRGFLYGPYCPIYGFGALIVLNFAAPFAANPILVFLICVVFTSVLEYISSWAMEKIFNARWWDYSSKPFNINGRVCLRNSLLFGVMGIGAVYFAHAFVDNFIELMSYEGIKTTALALVVLLFADTVFSAGVVSGLSGHFQEMQFYINELKRYNDEYAWYDKRHFAKSLENLRAVCVNDSGSESAAAIVKKLDEMNKKRSKSRSIIKAYPRIKISGMEKEFEELKKKYKEKQEKKRS